MSTRPHALMRKSTLLVEERSMSSLPALEHATVSAEVVDPHRDPETRLLRNLLRAHVLPTTGERPQSI